MIYTGVTANLAERIAQHRSGRKFAKKYNLSLLVYAEPHPTMLEAIAREKAVKEWPRLSRLRLIQESNPDWRDLYATLNG
jgi:putative endonuclease